MASRSNEGTFEIYRAEKIIQNLPFEIECIFAYDDYLMVGTKIGHLLIYRFELKKSTTSASEMKLTPELMRTNRYFTKRPITQLEALPEFDLFLCLSDSQVTVHNLVAIESPLIPCDLLTKCRGATMFVTNIQRYTALTGEETPVLRLCVVIKKRLALFYWKNETFHELSKDLALPDTPKSISWIGESLFIGFRSEYLLLKVTGEQKELFQLGKHPEPLISSINSSKYIALCRDEKTYILDSEGNPILSYEIIWSECPLGLVDDMPYLISLLPNSIIQVQTMEPNLNVQKFTDLNRNRSHIKSIVKTINRKGRLFVFSNNDIMCIKAVPYQVQITQMVKEKEFKLARKLADLAALENPGQPVSTVDGGMNNKKNASVTNSKETNLSRSPSIASSASNSSSSGIFKKDETIKQIENLEAFDLFCRKEFVESMRMFTKLRTDPVLVIGLFPNLLPASCQAKVELQYPATPPNLSTSELKTGLKALVDYLLNIRRQLVNETSSSQIHLRAMIDTTLLKCYLETSDALVAPLLRLSNSQCILEDSEAALMAYNKLNELIILYQSKGLHRKALDKMLGEPSLFSVQRIVQYLQYLPKDQLDLVFEYAVPILRSNPEEGLRIFTEEIGSETEDLPRERILSFLEITNEELMVPYLEHIIDVWNDQSPHFHNQLIYKLRDKVMKLMPMHRTRSSSECDTSQSETDGRQTDPDDSWTKLEPESPIPGKEPGELGYFRTKLLKFLGTSKFYATEILEEHFKKDEMWPELALVKGKSGDHEAALHIYINTMSNVDLAFDYCDRIYKNRETSSDSKGQMSTVHEVYYLLCKLLLKADHEKTVLQTINQYPQRVDPVQVLQLLPDSIALSEIKEFLTRSMVEKLQDRRFGQIYRSLLMSQHIKVQGQRVRLQQSNRVIIADNDLCNSCQKRIGKSAFLRYPNSHLIHYSCKDNYNRSFY